MKEKKTKDPTPCLPAHHLLLTAEVVGYVPRGEIWLCDSTFRVLNKVRIGEQS